MVYNIWAVHNFKIKLKGELKMTTIITQFAENNIQIISTGPHQYSFEFNGDENEFVDALKNVMETYGYTEQDADWFPGDPNDEGDDAYYIENADEDLYIAFNWDKKEVVIS